MTGMTPLQSWLLEGPAFVQTRAYDDGLLPSPGPAALAALRAQTLRDPLVQSLFADLLRDPQPALTSHKSAGHPLHKLVFLADLGLTLADSGISAVAERVLATASAQGPFRVMMNIHPARGGSGQDELAWALCDAPLALYALAKFGLGDQPAVLKAAEFLTSLVRANGWPCEVSPEVGKFRGPGKKDDPCPFANLIMLQALAQFPQYAQGPEVRAGVESALDQWANRRERHPYLFYMGNDFCKLKAPFIWYDLLHVLEVLTRFPWAISDERLGEMVAILRAKADSQGRYTPESVWLAWKDWEFGQKKVPSRWVTLLAERIIGTTNNQ